MYAISNNNRAGLIKQLDFFSNTPGDGNKTANYRRRARLAIDMLNRAKPIDANAVKKERIKK
jgi:hypothetical protein